MGTVSSNANQALTACTAMFYSQPPYVPSATAGNCTFQFPTEPQPAFCNLPPHPGSLYESYTANLQLSCLGEYTGASTYSCFGTAIMAYFAGSNDANFNGLAGEIICCIFLGIYFLVPVCFGVYVLLLRSEVKTGGGHLMRLRKSRHPDGESLHRIENLPVYLSYHHLEYSVKVTKQKKKELIAENGGKHPTTPGWNKKLIIKNITGVFAPGTLTAIMGPSGCGKSTLLDILADRKHGGYTRGKVLVNGRPRDIFFKRLTGYVMQFDALFPYLTVRETLTYIAELRLPGLDRKVKDDAVATVIKELDLKRCADSRVGGNGVPGISGGQARRVTVGMELVTRPRVLFLDEPTTGLDSYSSLQLVRTLRLLADTGRTVMCTIHQPRPDIFVLFDNLVLMKDGCLAYQGKVSGIPSYLEHIGIEVPAGASVADFIVDLTYSRPSDDGVDKVALLMNAYSTSHQLVENKKLAKGLEYQTMEGLPQPAAAMFVEHFDLVTGAPTDRRESHRLKFSQPLAMQVFTLMRRSYMNQMRDKNYFTNVAIQMCQFLFYGLLFLGLRQSYTETFATASTLDAFVEAMRNNYWFITDSGFIRLFSMRGFLFQVMMTIMLIEFVVIGSAFLEKIIFRREHASGAYSVMAYHLQYIIRFFIDAIWKAILASVMSWFMPPSEMSAGTFFFFFATLAVASTMGSAMAFFMVSLVPDAEGAANIYSILIGTFGVYSGYYLFPSMFPVFMKWLYFLLPFKYSYEALERNEFGFCMSTAERDYMFNLDIALSRWTNLIIFMIWPMALHLAAILASFAHTRPKSYWVAKMPCLFSADNFGESGDDDDDTQVKPAITNSDAANVNQYDVELTVTGTSSQGDLVAKAIDPIP